MKKLLLLSLIAPLSFSLFACGKSEEQKKEACIKIAEEEGPLSPKLQKDQTCLKVTQKDIDSFEKTHPYKPSKEDVADKAFYAHPDDSYFDSYKPKERKKL